MTRERLRYLILLALTAVILGVLFLDARGAWRTLWSPRWPVVIGAAALTALFPFCMALRWIAVLGAGGYRVGLLEGTAITMAAWPLGTLTPSKTGDLAKAFCVRDRVPLAIGLGSVAAERALDVIVLLAFSLWGALALGHKAIAVAAEVGIVAAIAGWAFLGLGGRLPLGEKWSRKLDPFGMAARLLIRRPGWLALSALGSALNWALSIWQTQLLYRAYGVEIPLLYVGAALPMALFVGLLPVTLAGMGTRDKALMFLCAPFAPEGISLSVGVLYSLCGYWLPSLAGLPFMRRLIRSPRD